MAFTVSRGFPYLFVAAGTHEDEVILGRVKRDLIYVPSSEASDEPIGHFRCDDGSFPKLRRMIEERGGVFDIPLRSMTCGRD